MREIVSLQVGQAGIQVGNSVWELYCKEHGISNEGIKIKGSEKETSKTDFSTFFNETKSGKRKNQNQIFNFFLKMYLVLFLLI